MLWHLLFLYIMQIILELLIHLHLLLLLHLARLPKTVTYISCCLTALLGTPPLFLHLLLLIDVRIHFPIVHLHIPSIKTFKALVALLLMAVQMVELVVLMLLFFMKPSLLRTSQKLLSVQFWYGYMLQDDDNDPIIIVYSLTTNILSTWRHNQVVQRFSTESSSLPTSSPTLPTTTPAVCLPQTLPSFRSITKVNISYYPKRKDKIQWCNFPCQLFYTAASHNTLEFLDPNYVPNLEDQDSFHSKQRFMYNIFSN
jgi:hypothetical protein